MNLSENDARSIIRLLGETAMINGSFSDRKFFLMKGLCSLIDADYWAWALGCQMEPMKPQVFVSFIHGGFSDSNFANFIAAVEHPGLIPVVTLFTETMKKNNTHTTMRRDEMDHLGLSYQGSVGESWEKANIGSSMMSAHPLEDGSASTIGLYRRIGAPKFSDRDKHIAHLILSEVPWLHLAGWPDDKGSSVPKLYPRQRVVMNLLLDVMSRKAIADHMNIKENTVAGYTKDIYRHFKVHSQVELLRKFL